jgi:hypothetical protein
MTLDLKMPDLYQELTVKIVDLAFIKGKDVYIPVVMFGDPKKFQFEMKIGKTIWQSIYDHLKELEDNDAEFSDFLGDSVFKVDEQLSCLKDRVITIKGMPDKEHTFVGKDDKVSYAKIFTVIFESDLEDAEKIGGDVYKRAVFTRVIDNIMCKECRLANTRLALNDIAKKENKEIEKEEKKKEKAEKIAGQKVEKEQEWVVKKREKQEKEDKKKAKLGDHCGWT